MEENLSVVRKVNFELDQYIHNVFHEVQSRVYADGEGVLKEDKFTEYMLDQLSEASETEGMVVCNYVKPNERGNIEFKINGYAIRDGFETIDLFITLYRDTNELYNVKKTEFEDMIKYVTRFGNAAIKGYLDEIDPSHTAWSLAKIIRGNYKTFDRVNIFLLSNGNIPHDPPSNFRLKGFDELRFIFHIWDIERFHRLSQSKDNREPIEITFCEIYEEAVPCLKMPVDNEVYECYLAIVPGKILSILYDNYSTRLLESNVRAFLQQTGNINKGIRDTIRGERPYMFLPYNNGLAVTASEVETEIKDGQLLLRSVRDFQIVNGGQTTASLFHTEKKHKASLAQVYVQMKLTVIKDQELKNREVPNISKFANSQNKVSDLDLSSNHPFLQRLEQLSRTTYAIDPENHNKQTIWFFERVKGQYKELYNKEPTKNKQDAFKIRYPTDQKFVKSEIGKLMNTWKCLPYNVSLGAEKNYPKFMESVEKEFAKKQPGKVYYEDLIANAILFRKAEQLYGRKGKDPVGDTNIRSFVVTYSLSLLYYLTDHLMDLGKIWNEQRVSEGTQVEIYRLLQHVYQYLTSSQESLISEFARKKYCWEELIKLKYEINRENLTGCLLTPEEHAARYSEETGKIKEAEQYAQTEKLSQLGLAFWDGFSKWLLSRDDFSTIQKNFAANIKSKMFRLGTFSDTEIRQGLQLLQQFEKLEITSEYICSLSSYKDVKAINTAEIYHRISQLTDKDWQKIMDVGDQTKSLNFNDISVIRTVVKKLKQGEQIDFKRLSVINDCLDKVKKYGIKF
ncbi:AIPR family protein [Mucilaginibacter sp. R-33]|uniref:AIPR family protein n=1 Tax=Mucilaginibacter sp. R-33 TaxID=3416711 RepID=UPI003CF36066